MCLNGTCRQPEEVIMQYHLETLSSHWWIYRKIRKGMPGLKQSGKAANKRLVDHLENYGYAPCKETQSFC